MYTSLHVLRLLAYSLTFLLFLTASAERAFAILRQDHLDITMRAWDYMHGSQFTYAFGSGSASIRGSLDGAHVTTNHHGHVSSTDIFTANQCNVCGLDHRIRGFNCADEAS